MHAPAPTQRTQTCCSRCCSPCCNEATARGISHCFCICHKPAFTTLAATRTWRQLRLRLQNERVELLGGGGSKRRPPAGALKQDAADRPQVRG